MAITIVICTCDRPESLRATLAALANCRVPGGLDVELLVIDNGDIPQTSEVVEGAKILTMEVRYVREPRRGLSICRNTGVALARGGVILCTDDDVRPPVDWIAGMCEPILSGEADAVAGGLHFPAKYEARFRDEPFASRRGWFGAPVGIDAAAPERMIGANMAFSRAAADAVGGFEPALGAGASGFHEESLFTWRLQDAGYRVVSAFGVSVEHCFDISRVTHEYMVDHARRLARSSAYMDSRWPQYRKPVERESWFRGFYDVVRRCRHQTPNLWRGTIANWQINRTFAETYYGEIARLKNATAESDALAARQSEKPVVASIILCTRNRAEDVRKTLESLGEVEIPEGLATELLLIDNGSTDHTAEVVRAAVLKNMPVRYLYEGQVGKCAALNRGIAAARGSVLIFTDDDVRFPKNWVAAMAGPIVSGKADAIQGGVKLAPHLVRPWFNKQTRSFLAMTQDMNPGELEGFVGANFAISRALSTAVAGFDLELGPGLLGAGEETLFAWQVKTLGCRIGSALDTCIEHHPQPARLHRASFLRQASNTGASFAYLDYHWRHIDADDCTPLSVARATMRLAYWRLKRAADCRMPEGIADWELDQVKMLAYMRHYLKEKRRARNYARHGTRKEGGVPSTLSQP